VSNTAVTLDGKLYSEVLWPLPDDESTRRVLLPHECFHRLQKEANLPVGNEVPNQQLDTEQGRYLLRLEFQALMRALGASGEIQAAAIHDALLFRARRYQLFPGAAAEEHSLEHNEGLAEYTGVKLALSDPAAQRSYAVKDIHFVLGRPSFVRSFAYGTGSAYGLLLDAIGKPWREVALKGAFVDELLGSVTGFRAPADLAKAVATAGRSYDAAAILASEQQRSAEMARRRADYRARLIDGAVVKIPLQKMNIQFNPTELFPMDEAGTVYPTLRVSDLWGMLEVKGGGALLSSDWKTVTGPVPPGGIGPENATGDWQLHLKPGYELAPGPRKGDYTVAKRP
jgi:hypothetical protein